jgi:hypothetical protein
LLASSPKPFATVRSQISPILIRKSYGSISGIQFHRLMQNVLATTLASLSDSQTPPVSKKIFRGRMRPFSGRVICSIPWYPVAHQPNCRRMRIACLSTDEVALTLTT